MAAHTPKPGAGDIGPGEVRLSADGYGFPIASRTLPVDQIRVGERHRKDLGDIDALAANIQRVGLLQPIVVTPDGFLLCGERRLRAAKLLGWKMIPVTIVTAPIESGAAARRGAK